MQPVNYLSPYHFDLHVTTNQTYPLRFQLNKYISQNLYEILGVEHNATTNEISSAYKREALKWHPDKNLYATGNKAYLISERFKAISNAVSVLLNTETRDEYDASAEENQDTFTQNTSMTHEDAFIIFTDFCVKSIKVQQNMHRSKMSFFASVVTPLLVSIVGSTSDTANVAFAVVSILNGDGARSVMSELSDTQKKDFIKATRILMESN